MFRAEISAAFLCLALAGCNTAGTPIVAGAVDQVGIAVSGGVQDQGANMTLGYRGAKFAVVPVQTSDGKQLSLYDGPNKEKGFSVFALLGIDKSAGGTSPSIGGIEQVVAVGPAADIYAAGRARLTVEQARAAGLIQ
jgi:hypothetical protein